MSVSRRRPITEPIAVTPTTIPPPLVAPPAWHIAAKRQLKKILSWQTIVVLLFGGGFMVKKYDSDVVKKPEVHEMQAASDVLSREVLKLTGRVTAVEGDINDIKMGVRDIGIQLLEIAKTTGARQTIPPASTTPTP